MSVLQVATQGYGIASGGKVQKKDKCWVESYTLSFSTDGSQWQQYTENGAVKVILSIDVHRCQLETCISLQAIQRQYTVLRPLPDLGLVDEQREKPKRKTKAVFCSSANPQLTERLEQADCVKETQSLFRISFP